MSLWIRLCNHTYIHTYIHLRGTRPLLRSSWNTFAAGSLLVIGRVHA